MKNKYQRPLQADTRFILFTILICLLIISWKYFGSVSFHESVIVQQWNITVIPSWTYHFIATSIFLGVIPFIIQVIFLKKQSKLNRYRFNISEHNKINYSVLLFLSLLFIALSYNASEQLLFKQEYPYDKNLAGGNFFLYSLFYVIFYYLPWEYFYRQFIQTTLLEFSSLAYAISFQVLASSLAHIGKPPTETYGAIMGGIIWGYWAHQNKSILFPLITHAILGISLDFFIVF